MTGLTREPEEHSTLEAVKLWVHKKLHPLSHESHERPESPKTFGV